ncbi:MAG: AraC family transcriptional regulator [Clostridia bacterium]|nr:AraC family transcriptional regulator [Clostridia bacterium]
MGKSIKLSSSNFSFSHSKSAANANENLNTRHCHDTFEILFVAEGRGRYLIEGAEFELKPRTLVLIKPFEYHCVEVETGIEYERYVLHFTDASVVREVKETIKRLADESAEDSGSFYSPDSISQTIVSLFDRFEGAEQLSEEDKESYFKLLLSELVTLLSFAGNQKIAHDDGELGARVIKYINEYLERDISLDVIAKRFFVSKYYLCRAFKRYSGVSIHAYITQKRVVYAKQLIESGETASGAAYKVGFGDYSAFYRAYMKVFGKPPTSNK